METRESDVELSSDDEDFKPEEEQPSDDELSDDKESDDEEQQTSNVKKKRCGKTVPEVVKTEKISPEAEKKRLEALWSDFLGDSSTQQDEKKIDQPQPVKETVLNTNEANSCINASKSGSTEDIFVNINSKDEYNFKERVLTEKSRLIPTSSNSNQLKSLKRPKTTLNTMLNQISKKSKASILESTKSDWEGYKSAEGITEELRTFNRGRNG
jgi:hypothetical protein